MPRYRNGRAARAAAADADFQEGPRMGVMRDFCSPNIRGKDIDIGSFDFQLVSRQLFSYCSVLFEQCLNIRIDARALSLLISIKLFYTSTQEIRL